MKWISIKDKLPEFNKRVLMHSSKSNIIITRVVHDPNYPEDDMWHDDDGYSTTLNDEQYWMELPERHE